MKDCNQSLFPGDSHCVCEPTLDDWRSPTQCMSSLEPTLAEGHGASLVQSACTESSIKSERKSVVPARCKVLVPGLQLKETSQSCTAIPLALTGSFATAH